ncbi:MAG: inorganic diphosphatase [Pseudomonadales bacterium]|jgi:inorganic pyrophosphatase|nr:inorganic diphosphatase [Pseudomonadales bacterium]
MSLSSVSPGAQAPDEVNVIIEIPANSGPVKYEVDKVTGAIFVDRFMATPMFYPCNYGYVNETLADDGDPLDVLVITPFPVLSGAVLPARPIGVLRMIDEAGEDAKILAVPPPRLSGEFAGVDNHDDVSPHLLRRIEHFFEHYKDLEPGKWVKLAGWGDAEEARQAVVASIERHRDAQ